jgi:outer membrane protein TolC
MAEKAIRIGEEGGCMKRIFFLASVLVSLLLPFRAVAEEMKILTLEQALQIASEKNRDIGKAREYARWVQGKYMEERAAAFPQLTMTGSGVLQQDKTLTLTSGSSPDTLKSASAEIGLTQTLFAWGKVGAAIRAAKEGLKTADEQLRLYRQAAFRDVSISFFDVLLAKQIHSIALQDLAQKERHLEEAQRKLAAGIATDYEVLAAEVAVENARPEVIRSENQIQYSLDRLGFLLAFEGEGFDVVGSLETSISPVPVYREIYTAALEQRPEMKDLRLRAAIAGELVNIAAAEDKPRLEFKGGYGWKGLKMGEMNLSGQAWNAGIYITFPFFDGMKTKGKVAQAESDRRSLTIDESKLADSIALQARDALNAVRESKKIVNALSGTVAQAEKLLFLSEKGYEFGVKIRLEVEDAELKLQLAKGNLSRAWRDYRAARVNLLWAMGVLGENASQ